MTAIFVVFARAVGAEEPGLSSACRDERAQDLSVGPLRRLLDLARSSPIPSRSYAILRRVTLGLVDHLSLRTAVIDDAVRGAIARGATQLVVLGAGFDSRAHRMIELAQARVFEVDHPSTQGLKRRKAAPLPVFARELHYARATSSVWRSIKRSPQRASTPRNRPFGSGRA